MKRLNALWNKPDSQPSLSDQDDPISPDSRSALSRSPESIQSWLVSSLAAQLELPFDEIDIQKDFTDYGLNSIDAVNLAGGLENFLDCRLSPTLVWDYPNIQTLVQHLGGMQPAATAAVATEEPPIEMQPAEARKLLANLDKMPDETVDTLLNAMLPEMLPEQKST